MTILNIFANQAGQIPLSELDTNFATPITIGTTPIVLGQTAGTITGLTLAGANLGTPTGNLANCTFPTLNQNTTGTASNVTGIVAVGNGGTGVTTSTGSGSTVLNTSPTLVTPLLGTPTSGTLTTCTGLPLTTGITGILPVLNGGTGVTTPAIVAGTGISVSGTWPNQTINSTAAGTVTSIGTTGSVNGITLTGTVTTSGNLTLGGTLSGVALTSQVTGVLPIANGGTGGTVGGVMPIQPITASVGSSALTCTLSPTILNFRNTPLTSGTINTRTVATAISVVVPSTATLGTVSAQQSRLILIALDNAGTIELGVVNIAGGTNLDETTLISTTAISAAATSASVVYSTTARTSLPFRVVGYIESTQATAGTWATAPSTIQGEGGQALAAMSSLGYGQTWQVVTGSRAASTTYYNTTGKPIFITIFTNTAGGTSTLIVNGVVINTVASGGIYGYNNLIGIIPPNASYSATSLVAGFIWTELR